MKVEQVIIFRAQRKTQIHGKGKTVWASVCGVTGISRHVLIAELTLHLFG